MDKLKLEVFSAETWGNRAVVLAGMTYAEYLISPEWLRIKAKARKRDHYKRCYVCKKTDVRLEIHHRTYKWIGTPHAMRGLVALCREHHQLIHDISKNSGRSVRLSTRKGRRTYEKSQRNLSLL